MKEIVGRCNEDGRSWDIGALGAEPTVLEGANHLAPYDAWATKLAPIQTRSLKERSR